MITIGRLAPLTGLRRVDAAEHAFAIGAHEDDDEGSAVAIEVVAHAGGSTEHRGFQSTIAWRAGELHPLVRDWVPDDEIRVGAAVVEEDAAVASVERPQSAVVGAGRAAG